MGLEKNTVSIPFAQGVDTKTDPNQVKIGKLLTLENGYFNSPLAIGKRNGYQQLGLTLNGSYGLAPFQDEAVNVGVSDNALSSYSPTAGTWGDTKGFFQPIDVKIDSVFQSATFAGNPDSAQSAAGLQLFAWSTTSNSISYSVIDNVSGDRIVNGASVVTTGTFPRVLILGSSFVILYFNTATSRYEFKHVEFATPTTISAAIVLTSATAEDGDFDAVVFNSRIYTAGRAAVGSIHLRYIDTSFVVSAQVTEVATDGPTRLAVWGDPSNNLWVAWFANGANTLRVAVYSSSLAPVLVPTVIDTPADVIDRIAGVYDTTISKSQILYEVPDSGVPTVRSIAVTVGGVATASTVLLRGVVIHSRAYIDTATSAVMIVVAYTSLLQGAYFVIKATASGVTVAKAVAKISGSQSSGGAGAHHPVAMNNPTANVYQFATAPLQQSLISGSGVTTILDAASSVVLTVGVSLTSGEIANELHLSGGFITMYDGAAVVEHGFHIFPEGITAVVAAGGSIAAGTYQYICTYEWLDNQGQIHRSATSIPLTVVVVGAAQKVTLTIPTLRITTKTGTSSPVVISVYRTTAAGTLFFRLTGQTTPANNPTVDTIAYVDTLASASIIGNTQLYTTGGEVSNGDPNGVISLTTYKDRLIALPAENRQQFWYTKQVIPGSPVEFSPFFTQNIDSNGGDASAVASMDDKLIIFKRGKAIFVVTGDGPSPSGAGNDFTSGQQITTDAGCIAAASVVLMPDGLMFQSETGIELLNRGLSTEYVGADVETYMAGATVTSAVLVAPLNQVRFTLNTGICLVYDYYMKAEDGIGQWSVFTNHAAVGATMFQDVFTYVQADGKVYQETPGVFTDAGAFIQLKLVTAWLSLKESLQGYHRIYKAMVLGTYKSAHHLNVGVAYDFDSTIVQTEDITAVPGLPYQWRILLNRQKCEAIQFQIEDTQASGFGEGLALSSLALEVGAKGGLNRSPTSRTYG